MKVAGVSKLAVVDVSSGKRIGLLAIERWDISTKLHSSSATLPPDIDF